MLLSDNDAKRLHDFYAPALAAYGAADSRAVQWSDEASQQIRFEALVGAISAKNLWNKRILDVGCGTGELYKFFLENKIPIEYSGIDIVPEFIVAAKGRFPDAVFQVKDVFEITESYDFVIASGALSFKVADNENYSKRMIEKMWNIARDGLAFNMLNLQSHVDDDTYAAYDPKMISDFCIRLCPEVGINTNYSPRDFTVYMRKQK